MKENHNPLNEITDLSRNPCSIVMHILIVCALLGNGIFLYVISQEIKDIGNLLSYFAAHDQIPSSERGMNVAYAELNNDSYAGFVKNRKYPSILAAYDSNAIPVRIVGTPVPVEVINSEITVTAGSYPLEVIVENSSFDPVPVEVDP